MDQPPPHRVPITARDVRLYLAQIRAAVDIVELDRLTRDIWRRYQEDGLERIELAVLSRRRLLKTADDTSDDAVLSRKPDVID